MTPVGRLAATETAQRQRIPGLLDAPVTLPLLGGGDDLAAHERRYGERPRTAGRAGAELLRTLEEIALTGRGGAHFPAARKWAAVRSAAAPAVVVANAAESEPASGKDAALLCRRPHLVLDGLVCAAEAVAADQLVVWLHGGDHAGHRAVERALAERRAAGLAEPAVRLVSGPATYLSGESSAIVRGLSGGPVLPELRRLPAAARGVHGRPTLVHNVETLARVALAARTGSAGHRPTSLLTVTAGGVRTVLEADPSWSLGAVVRAGGWGWEAEPAAVLLGGYGGVWLPWTEASVLPVHEPAVRMAGGSLGAGVVVPLPRGACGVAETAAIAGYLAAAGARQCGPCLFGLPSIAGVVASMAAGTARRSDLRALRRYLAEVDGRGACGHPDGAVRLVASMLSTFAGDVAAHLRGRRCAGSAYPLVVPVPAGR